MVFKRRVASAGLIPYEPPASRKDPLMSLRNIAIIAHVDHGKTTLVDQMLAQSGAFRANEAHAERAMDSNDQERERGITILAKATSVPWHGAAGETRINIIDTPGHADFGGEVERILGMVDGCLLLVDAEEGVMPQTKFVLGKALKLGLRPIVVLNKVDRPHADPDKVLGEAFDLFAAMGASDEQLDFPHIYASGKQGWAVVDIDDERKDLAPLFEKIVEHVPAPAAVTRVDEPARLLAVLIESDPFLGRLLTGRVESGRFTPTMAIRALATDGTEVERGRVSKILAFRGLKRQPIEEALAGDIVAIAGLSKATVADTLGAMEAEGALPAQPIDPPTIAITVSVNDSPLAGRDGDKVQSRVIRERLLREAEANVAIKVAETAEKDAFEVAGRGELQLGVLIETMRREGFEVAVSRPQVIFREIGGVLSEPMENLVIDVPTDYQGAVIESLGRRIGQLQNMAPEGNTRVRLEYLISSRGLMGFKGELMTMTKGQGMMHHSFAGYGPKGAEPPPRPNGVLVAKEQGKVTGYALSGLQERSDFFLGPGVDVYEGMIVGTNSRQNDMIVNPCKAKALTNMRSKATDDAIQLEPPKILSLEQALEFIDDDELVEVTPQSIRLRKKVLNASLRKRSED
jgi:GTP-binding protein